RRNTSNAVPQPEVRAAIEFNVRYLQVIEGFAGDFLQDSVQRHRQKAPSRSKFNQHRLTGLQNFGLKVRFSYFDCRFHTPKDLMSCAPDLEENAEQNQH